jgi:hypothetical protein
MNKPNEIIKYKGYEIGIFNDMDPQSPLDWDNLGTMVTWHKRSAYGHEQPKCGPDEWMENFAIELDGSVERKIRYWKNGNGWAIICKKYPESDKWQLQQQAVEDKVGKIIRDAIYKHCIMFELYMYEHSGVAFSISPFHDPWDSGQLGVIYVKKDKIKKEYGCKVINNKMREKIKERLMGELDTYENYVNGSVYGFEIRKEGDEYWDVDSCWGFFGYDKEKNGLLEHAKSSIDYTIKHEKETTMLTAMEDFSHFLDGDRQLTIIRQVKVRGYKIKGTVKMSMWGGGEGTIEMDPVEFDMMPTKEEIQKNINDGQFGCQSILEADVKLLEIYDNGGEQYMEEYHFNEEEIRDAKRGV